MIGIRLRRLVGPQAPRQLEPVELRHHHVEHREVGLLAQRQLQRLLAVACLEHRVARALEPERDQREDVLVVVGGKDDGLVTTTSSRFVHVVTSVGCGIGGRIGQAGQRQLDREGGADAELALDGDRCRRGPRRST